MVGRRRLGHVAGLLALLLFFGVGACAHATAGDDRVVAAPTSSADVKPSPSPTTSAGGGTGGQATGGGSTTTPPACPQGAYQAEIERALNTLGGFGHTVPDGLQTEADCKVIKKFQDRYGLRPVDGNAGPQTIGAARRLLNTDIKKCGNGTGLTVCVDLTNQTVFAKRDGKVVLAPTIARSGMAGFATPAGTFHLTRKNIKEWSYPYKVWLPYFQHFYDGMGFHETVTYIYGANGSHGCVNMLGPDVRALWKLTRVGTTVTLYGRRPGT